ncbi:MAG: hypothetical protein HQL86_03440 [Magnetococcales bacterium]|nr:hypothetical protein [Magnetococcales bacterium]
MSVLSSALQSHCGDAFRVVQGGRTLYVAMNLPDEAFLLDKARCLTTFTPAQLALNLPMPKARVAPALTRLLESGEILCIGLKADFTPILRLSGSGKPGVFLPERATPNNPANSDTEDETALHRAFLQIGQGRNFVAIHRLRAHLGWERQRFDQTVLRLQSAERILLNMGDPTRLTRAELDGAYKDRNGMRYLTLNWLESQP